jgi:DNA-binding response OmpR family regulator
MTMTSTVTFKKILVVDDDRDIREIIIMILEAEGYHVSGLDKGEAVVTTVQETRPDLLLLDIQLGDRDGRDICRELKQHPATQAIPIMMISANHGRQSLCEKECNADDFLAKPFDITELVAHVKRFAA